MRELNSQWISRNVRPADLNPLAGRANPRRNESRPCAILNPRNLSVTLSVPLALPPPRRRVPLFDRRVTLSRVISDGEKEEEEESGESERERERRLCGTSKRSGSLHQTFMLSATSSRSRPAAATDHPVKTHPIKCSPARHLLCARAVVTRSPTAVHLHPRLNLRFRRVAFPLTLPRIRS